MTASGGQGQRLQSLRRSSPTSRRSQGGCLVAGWRPDFLSACGLPAWGDDVELTLRVQLRASRPSWNTVSLIYYDMDGGEGSALGGP